MNETANKVYCTNRTECKDVKLYNFTAYGYDNMKCVRNCSEYVWYNYNENNYCTNQTTCDFEDEQLKHLDKRNMTKECIETC